MAHQRAWTLLHARLHRVLRQRQLLPKQQRVMVGVSGGQDSLCLMRLLLDLQPKWQWQLAIAHCDHCWRTDSAANARYIQKLAGLWKVPYYSAVAEAVPQSEAAARAWRYQVLSAIATDQKYSHLVTGHTASDRAETLLYNLMRGSGADGLQALTWKRELAPGVQLVRPLLEITRAETEMFCRATDLVVWEDTTNQDTQYARNRIRQELLPYLKSHFNPQVEQTLAQTAELLRADVECLEIAAYELYQRVNQGDKICRAELQSAPLALQRRVMRQWLQQSLPKAPSFEQIEKLTGLISAPNRTQTDPFPGGAIAIVQDDWIQITTAPAVPNTP